MSSQVQNEINDGNRFEFGKNWVSYLKGIDDEKINLAEQSLINLLKIQDLQGKDFLDIGCGSGLFSLVARKLGANVHSFDYDPQAVECAKELKSRYFNNDDKWVIEEGSVLDDSYVRKLGNFNVVYSWGVLHHTGDMYKAFENIVDTVKKESQLYIAIYNDQGFYSKYWNYVKCFYNKGTIFKLLIIIIHTPYLFFARYIFHFLTGCQSIERGMSLWHDMIDWLGGYPFEVAKPESIFKFFRDNGFFLEELKTCGGRMGCNEYVFRRK